MPLHLHIYFLRGKELNETQEQYFCYGAESRFRSSLKYTTDMALFDLQCQE